MKSLKTISAIIFVIAMIVVIYKDLIIIKQLKGEGSNLLNSNNEIY